MNKKEKAKLRKLKEEFEKRLEETRKRNKIKELEAELEKLKQQ